ncbi:MAG TPA: hypothetical protein VGL58_19890 [Caulobacteraceae bacterium]
MSRARANAREPVVKPVVAAPKPPRLGFLAGKISVPDDFDSMFEDEIAEMFGVED